MLKNEYLVAKFGLDTAENEPCQVCPISAYAASAALSRALDLFASGRFAQKASVRSTVVIFKNEFGSGYGWSRLLTEALGGC